MTGDRPADITSQNNRWIKLARSLHRRKQRYKERAILIEGVRAVREALMAEAAIRVVLLSSNVQADSEAARLATIAHERGLRVLSVSDSVFRTACETETPQGILAIATMPEIDRQLDLAARPLVLVIDAVRDPGNVGTLLRSALGAGVDAVLIAPNSADPFSPKVIRAGAGSHFRLKLLALDWEDPPALLKRCNVWITDADAPTSYDKVDWVEGSAIVVGNETSGPSSAAFRLADGIVGIPLANELESLNAGIAGSVIMFEARRQRRAT